MIHTESYPIHVYVCPYCESVHPVTKKSDKPFKGYLESYRSWTEICPRTGEPVRVTNLYFIDKL